MELVQAHDHSKRKRDGFKYKLTKDISLGIPCKFRHGFSSIPSFTCMEMDCVEMDMYNPFQVQAEYTIDPTINRLILITSANYLK